MTKEAIRIVVLALGALLLCTQWSCATVGTTAARAVSPGERRYREHCGRCHEAVRAHAYSDAQWQGVMGRMQPEAHLSDADARSILIWLRSSN
jgi:mono/diheme cytochrome c family protein